jgi:transposase
VLSFLSNTRVYLAAGATDLKKSFDTLAGVVRESLRLDPLSGHLFVFANSRKNRIKILFWDNTGWWVCAKRLEAGTLVWPVSPTPSIELSSEELTLFHKGS